MRRIMRQWFSLAVMSLALGACQSVGVTRPQEPLPTYQQVREQYNQRTEKLPRLWTKGTVRVTTRDERGRTKTEQGDAYLQVILPDRVSLSVGKSIADFYFYLGSNSEWFWWVDVLDRDNKSALVGRHARTSPERAAEFGVPVHPLDLVEMVGMTSLPESGPEPVWSSKYGAMEIQVPGRWGDRRIWINHLTFEPSRIELLDAAGAIAAAATLSRYEPVDSRWPGADPSIAGRIEITMPRIEAEITIDLDAPFSGPDKPKDAPFDLMLLLRAKGVPDDRIALLDEESSN